MRLLKRYLREIGGCILLLSASVYAETLLKFAPMQVDATIQNGCFLNDRTAGVANLGAIRFDMLELTESVYATSRESAGSIILRCTPGASVTIALNAGENVSNIAGGRQLKHNKSTAVLRYQLYQDSGYSKVWGDGTNGGSSVLATANGEKMVFAVYAKLMPAISWPPAGDYQDTVTVTVAY